MKIQISQTKKIEDALCVWPEQGEQVDLVLDPRPPYGFTFKCGTVKVLYVFGLLGMTCRKDIPKMLKNFYDVLAPSGQLYIIELDFDYITRAYLGGDITLEEFREKFIRASYHNKESVVGQLKKVGFAEKKMKQWFNVKFRKEHYEFIISAEK